MTIAGSSGDPVSSCMMAANFASGELGEGDNDASRSRSCLKYTSDTASARRAISSAVEKLVLRGAGSNDLGWCSGVVVPLGNGGVNELVGRPSEGGMSSKLPDVPVKPASEKSLPSPSALNPGDNGLPTMEPPVYMGTIDPPV